MAICPKCKYEYKIGVTVCPDCNEELVDHIPVKSAAMVPDRSWVSVCRLPSPLKTAMAKGALDSSNIPSIVMSSSFTALGQGGDMPSGMMQPSLETNVLMVPKEFHQEADLILQAILGDEYDNLQTGTT